MLISNDAVKLIMVEEAVMIIDQQYEKKGIVVIAALLVHLFLCTTFFIADLRMSDDHTLDFSHAPQSDAPIVFQDLNDPATQKMLQEPDNDNQWAAMTAAPSNFGLPDADINQLPDSAIQDAATDLAQADNEPTRESASADQSIAQSMQQADQNINTALLEKGTFLHSDSKSDTPKTAMESATQALTDARSPGTQQKAAQQLAAFTRGYLHQVNTAGENLVTLMGGDPTKRPGVEQLKYERYWAKIQWCIQNSFAINRDRYQPVKAIHCTMKIFFAVSRDGKISNLHIMQSSGHNELDSFMNFAINYAASSFPPLPNFIKDDPYPMTWLINVIVDTQPRYSAALH